MEMVKLVFLVTVAAPWLGAAGFSLTIGNAVAANIPAMKTAALAVRLDNCADLGAASLSATAEGLAAGERKSVPLQVVKSPTPGVYAVVQGWSGPGAWAVNLKAACGEAKAGALAPFHGANFSRESLKLFPRWATPAEADACLRELSGGNR